MDLSVPSSSKTSSLKEKLKKLNKAGETTFARTIKVKEFRKAKEYIIKGVKQVNTKYGAKFVLTIQFKKDEQCDFFPPGKQGEILKDEVILRVVKESVKSDNLKIVYDGKNINFVCASPSSALKDALKLLNKSGETSFPRTVKVKDLKRDKEYAVMWVKKVNTKYGPKVVVTVQFKKDEKCDFFLPSKQSEVILGDDSALNELVEAVNGDNPLKIVFDGENINFIM